MTTATMTTALVPWDSQVLDVCKQLQQKSPQQNKARQNIDSIKATIKNICIEGALSILDALGYHNDEFYLKNNLWKVRDFAGEIYFFELQGCLAKDTPVVDFWGGPPNKIKFYQGTLQTILEDRILCEIIHKGAHKIAQMIGLDTQAIGC